MKVSKISTNASARNSNTTVHEPQLSMYSSPPGDELSLDEFETFAVGRLIALRGIEKIKTQELSPKDEESKINAYIDENIKWEKTRDSFDEGRRRDHISHFILRLAHCQTEDQRRWFLTHESHLFRHRLSLLSPDMLLKFTKMNGLEFDGVSSQEEIELELKMKNASKELCKNAAHKTVTFYKIPFTQALDLVSRRQVLLSNGFAFVPSTSLTSIIVARFRSTLSKQLLQAKANFSIVTQDPRLSPLLNGVHRQYVGEDFSTAKSSGNSVTPENIDQVANRSMPLCMKKLHTTLKRDHKLKHGGRQQYWLFLKGAGMSLEDNIRFFQNEFSKIMSVESFNKDHVYNIRHLYGKEGKRANYSPFSCLKIIMGSAPPPGEAHGCPFRHMDQGHLSNLLGSLNINGLNRDKILEQVKGNHFQLACQRHFEIAHPDAMSKGVHMDGVGNHPNAWTAASLEYYSDKTTKMKDKNASGAPLMKTEPAAESATQEEETGHKMED